MLGKQATSDDPNNYRKNRSGLLGQVWEEHHTCPITVTTWNKYYEQMHCICILHNNRTIKWLSTLTVYRAYSSLVIESLKSLHFNINKNNNNNNNVLRKVPHLLILLQQLWQNSCHFKQTWISGGMSSDSSVLATSLAASLSKSLCLSIAPFYTHEPQFCHQSTDSAYSNFSLSTKDKRCKKLLVKLSWKLLLSYYHKHSQTTTSVHIHVYTAIIWMQPRNNKKPLTVDRRRYHLTILKSDCRLISVVFW